MIIPIIAVIILAIFFKMKLAWWEYLLVFFIPLAGIMIAKQVSIYSQTRATEYLNTYLVKAEYEEYWSTWDHETCTRTVCTGSGKSRICRTVTYDCSHCDSHQPSWTAWDNMGRSYNISQQHFEQLCKIWGKRQFVELNRSIDHHGTCGVDGDAYVTSYDGVFAHLQPVTNTHDYENRLQASKSVFNFQKVDKKDIQTYGLYEYKKHFDRFNYDPIFGTINPIASKRLSQWNALLGSQKQIHMNILVFKNKDVTSAEMQRSYWKGGNKNEFLLCIGVDNDNKIKWTKVISWTENEYLKINIERSVASMDYNLVNIIDTMAVHVRKDFKRKEFKDFKYLSIEPTPTATFVCFLITIILTIGLSIFSVKNEFNLEDSSKKYYRRNNRYTF